MHILAPRILHTTQYGVGCRCKVLCHLLRPHKGHPYRYGYQILKCSQNHPCTSDNPTPTPPGSSRYKRCKYICPGGWGLRSTISGVMDQYGVQFNSLPTQQKRCWPWKFVFKNNTISLIIIIAAHADVFGPHLWPDDLTCLAP